MRSTRIIAGAVVVAVGFSTAVTAGSQARPAATYSLSADKSRLKFNVSTIRAKAGSVTLRMTNPSTLKHDIAIKGKAKGRTVGKGGVSTVTVKLKKGTYTFYCAVGTHESAGMRGKLIVN